MFTKQEILEKKLRRAEQKVNILEKLIEDKSRNLYLAKEAVQKAHDELERRVEERTAELAEANEQLRIEIEDRKRAEAALEKSEAQLQIIVNNLPHAIFQINNDFKVVWANKVACEMNPDAVGQLCYKAFAHQEKICKDCNSIAAMNTGQIEACTKYHAELASIQGESYWEKTAVPLSNSKGEIIGVIEMARDVTERKRAEKEKNELEAKLQRAQRLEAIGTLAGGIAHDFNNLLTGIQGGASLMLMDMKPTHRHYERLKTIEKQVQSGARLTSHLLGYARKGKYEVKPVDLNDLVQETSDTFGRTRKDISINRELAHDLFAIEADRGQIELVLLNLFVNAADAMTAGGELILQTFNVSHEDMREKLYEPKPGNYVLLTVTDSGTGMHKKTMEQIFDPFFTTKERGRGTGLGLASVYGIIRGHGGYIDVESKRRKGTTFSIYLSASKKKAQKVIKTSGGVIKWTGTVLLVDDEEVILEVGKDLLETMGYRVLTAKDGKDAIKVYRKRKAEIDIIILDMVMPDMGGGEAYDRLKKIDPDIKVLLSSGYSIEGEATEILKRGCNGFIQKPFMIKLLSEKIMEILGKK